MSRSITKDGFPTSAAISVLLQILISRDGKKTTQKQNLSETFVINYILKIWAVWLFSPNSRQKKRFKSALLITGTYRDLKNPFNTVTFLEFQIVIGDDNTFMIFSIWELSREKIFFFSQILAPRAALLDKDFASQIVRLRVNHRKLWIIFFVVVGRGAIISLSVFWHKFVRGINTSITYF